MAALPAAHLVYLAIDLSSFVVQICAHQRGRPHMTPRSLMFKMSESVGKIAEGVFGEANSSLKHSNHHILTKRSASNQQTPFYLLRPSPSGTSEPFSLL
jgi:hypothetical protein